jgi:hypothetical protein
VQQNNPKGVQTFVQQNNPKGVRTFVQQNNPKGVRTFVQQNNPKGVQTFVQQNNPKGVRTFVQQNNPKGVQTFVQQNNPKGVQTFVQQNNMRSLSTTIYFPCFFSTSETQLWNVANFSFINSYAKHSGSNDPINSNHKICHDTTNFCGRTSELLKSKQTYKLLSSIHGFSVLSALSNGCFASFQFV